ncbi:MAG: TasA family protein, partial [Pseudonocardiaceae bacterium]
MNVQNKKKATIGVAIAAVGAAAIALGAGTFASFSSTQDGPDTTLAAGKLDFGESVNTDETLSDFVPGGDPISRTMTFTNDSASSLPGTVTLAFALADQLDNGCNGDEPEFDSTCASINEGELQDKLLVRVTSGATVLYDTGSLEGLDTISTPDVDPGESVTYTLEFSLPEGGETDNAVQGDSVR